MADSCLASLSVHVVSKNSFNWLFPLRSKPPRILRLSPSPTSPSSPSLFLSIGKEKVPSVFPHVARTSGWIGEESTGWKGEGKFAPSDGEEIEEGDAFAEGESTVDEEFVGGERDEPYSEIPEDAKLFVGNLPYDTDSEKLARLFQKAGIVEIAEVIYNRETNQSRGFGFVTMSSVEEAEQAVEIFHRYDWNGRLLTVNKAARRGSRAENSPPGELKPSLRIYVGNLPWRVDDAGLEQLFSEHGEVLSARVVYDRETGRSRGFGFVTMAAKDEVDDAVAALDGQKLEGRAIRVNAAEERPRRGSF